MTTPTPKRKPPVLRFDKENIFSEPSSSTYTISSSAEGVATCMLDVGTQTIEYEALSDLKAQVCILQSKLSCAQFRLSNFTTDRDVRFYTGFPNYRSLMAFYKFLGPAVNCLSYWDSEISGDVKLTQGRNWSLPPTEEFFLVLVQLPVGLLEKDLTDRFGISVSTVSRICITCINFIYICLKDIPLWPTHGLVQAHMPKVFKDLYPTTRVIIDATEIFVETPGLPKLQQLTFSSYKNHNIFKALLGISPGGVVTFVSQLFPGSIPNKQLTLKNGLIKLLERGDSIMSDRGFDIQDELTPLGIRINIPSFLSKDKKQFEENEMVETRRIAFWLRILPHRDPVIRLALSACQMNDCD